MPIVKVEKVCDQDGNVYFIKKRNSGLRTGCCILMTVIILYGIFAIYTAVATLVGWAGYALSLQSMFMFPSQSMPLGKTMHQDKMHKDKMHKDNVKKDHAHEDGSESLPCDECEKEKKNMTVILAQIQAEKTAKQLEIENLKETKTALEADKTTLQADKQALEKTLQETKNNLATLHENYTSLQKNITTMERLFNDTKFYNTIWQGTAFVAGVAAGSFATEWHHVGSEIMGQRMCIAGTVCWKAAVTTAKVSFGAATFALGGAKLCASTAGKFVSKTAHDLRKLNTTQYIQYGVQLASHPLAQVAMGGAAQFGSLAVKTATEFVSTAFGGETSAQAHDMPVTNYAG
jgi:pentapeptide MXKDX repeat protein